MAAPADRPAHLQKPHALEAEADDHYVRLLRKVTSTFVTPYDREDRYLRIETLDDVVDELDHTGSLIVGFELAELPKPLVRNANLLIEASELCSRAPELIRKQKKLEALAVRVLGRGEQAGIAFSFMTGGRHRGHIGSTADTRRRWSRR